MAYRNQSSYYGYNNHSMQRGTMTGVQGNACVPTAKKQSPVQNTDYICVAVAESESDCLAEMPLAMAYVPWQKFQNLNSPKEAFMQGTIFQDLDFDFYGRRCN